MNITQRMYFGQFPLDKDRDRRIVFYGRVSTQHEAQVDPQIPYFQPAPS